MHKNCNTTVLAWSSAGNAMALPCNVAARAKGIWSIVTHIYHFNSPNVWFMVVLKVRKYICASFLPHIIL